MLKNLKPEIKLFFLVALIAVVVAVGGILLLRGMMPAPQPSSSPQTLDTSGWQTYRNDEFGFEVKYPVESIIKEGGNNSIILEFPENNNLDSEGSSEVEIIFIPKTLENQTLAAYAQEHVEKNKKAGLKIQTELEETEIGQLKGYSYSGLEKYTNGYDRYFLLQGGEKDLFIEVLDLNGDPIVYQILSTFRFID